MASRWFMEAEQAIRNAGLVILSCRSNNHRVYRVQHTSGTVCSVTVSLSPRSIEQAVERLKRELKTRFERAHGN